MEFLPGEFRGQRNLAIYSPWCCRDSDMTEWLTLRLLLQCWISFKFYPSKSGEEKGRRAIQNDSPGVCLLGETSAMQWVVDLTPQWHLHLFGGCWEPAGCQPLSQGTENPQWKEHASCPPGCIFRVPESCSRTHSKELWGQCRQHARAHTGHKEATIVGLHSDVAGLGCWRQMAKRGARWRPRIWAGWGRRLSQEYDCRAGHFLVEYDPLNRLEGQWALYDVYQNHLKRLTEVDFPGGPVAKNPPVDAADTGSIRSGKIPHALGLLSLCATATEPAL